MPNEKRRTSASLRNNEAVKNMLSEFHDPEVREIYCNEFLNTKIATQIKVLREQREWTQGQLAELAEMKQERISVLEDVNYESWTLNVLRRLARAFDLRLDVEFKEFASFPRDFLQFGRDTLERESFESDSFFSENSDEQDRGSESSLSLVVSHDEPTQPTLQFQRSDMYLVLNEDEPTASINSSADEHEALITNTNQTAMVAGMGG
jgi:transcriptional regulator with XRE-family HTH domain